MSDLIAKIEELAELLNRHGLTALRWSEGETTVEVRRDAGAPSQTAAKLEPDETPEFDGDVVPSPMTGVFYRRPVPAEPPFIEEGDTVSVGEVIGVIEAMKVFNEVESPVGGVVTQFLAEDGAVVQEGDPLLVVRT
ncbi:MAG: hypothetical protein IH851_09765 [Armatimonadetes bacterium]|nr:hypothetical protein [Armatimonadota bacterium]